MIKRFLIAILFIAAVGGCAGNVPYRSPALPEAPTLKAGRFLRIGDVDAAQPASKWWTELQDPILNKLIEDALRSSPRMAMVTARLRQVRSALAGVRASSRPSPGLSTNYVTANLPDRSLGNSSGQIDLFNVGFDAVWEVDLWGAKRLGVEKARAQVEGEAANLADAQVLLSAEIAQNYILMRTKENVADRILERRQIEDEILELSNQRVLRGVMPNKILQDARIVLLQSEMQYTEVRSDMQILRDNIGVLVGGGPGSIEGIEKSEAPLPPINVMVGDPAGMISRRPDILAAERRLRAAHAQIGIERSRRFPRVTLLGLIGIGGRSASDVLDVSQLLTAGVPRISWDFLDFGRTHSAVSGAEANEERASAEYEGIVLSALQDVESALVRFGNSRMNYGRALEIYTQESLRAKNQEQLLERGVTGKPPVLAIHRQLINSEIAVMEKKSELTISYISLVKALGLGWQVPIN